MPKVRGETHTESFTVEFGPDVVQCQRTITTGRDGRMTQSIRVGAVSKNDPSTYGVRDHPVESMAGVARIIAFEIIGGR